MRLVRNSSSLWAGYTRISGVGRRWADTVLPLPPVQAFHPKLFVRSTPGTDVKAFWKLPFSFGWEGW